jgi:ABC-2 type transport system ATP-binding protein
MNYLSPKPLSPKLSHQNSTAGRNSGADLAYNYTSAPRGHGSGATQGGHVEPAVQLTDIVKTFDEFRAVDGLSLVIPQGEIFGLLGPNGAGKTTTIRMIMDIIRPDSGEVRVLGRRMGDGAKEQVGYLPEERGLYRKMKVIELLEFLGSIRGMSLSDARREAKTWLDRLALGNWADKKAEELSKGMQQKLQFIAAVMGKPPLLILDEPFSGMDPVNQDLFTEVMLDISRAGTTIIFSTHQMDTAERLCREIALINKGKVVLKGSLESLKESYGRNALQIEFDGDGSFLKSLPGVASATDSARMVELRLDPGADVQEILKAAVGRVRISRFELLAPTLHNIFIDQVGGVPVQRVPGGRADA